MIVTIRTGPHSQAQGPLVQVHTVRVFYTGEEEPTGRATIRVGEDLITGELIERKER